jgi:hypothetical protein
MTRDSAWLLVCLLSLEIAYSQDEIRKPRDFSKTNSVSVSFAQPERRGRLLGEGLEHAFFEADGFTTLTNVEKVACRSLSLTHESRSKGYFYFAIDPTFKRQDITRVRIDVDYFDGQQGVFGIQYDARREGESRGNAAYRQLLPNVALRDSRKWLTAKFHIKDAAFLNSQNGNADFRLWVSPPELCVKRVTITRESPQQSPKPAPLSFTATGEAILGDWNIQWDSGSKPTFTSHLSDAPRWLEIRSADAQAAGSWRTSVFLEPGTYQFAGKIKTTDLKGSAGLRASSRPGGQTLNQNADWTTLTYDFTVAASEYVELVCELRADQGTARFDADSLKLIRK